jgi:hypothetical protein
MPRKRRRTDLDAFIETYVCWREACQEVAGAYARWTAASAGERHLAFAAYRAALEREDRAAHLHRDVQRGIAPQSATG